MSFDSADTDDSDLLLLPAHSPSLAESPSPPSSSMEGFHAAVVIDFAGTHPPSTSNEEQGYLDAPSPSPILLHGNIPTVASSAFTLTITLGKFDWDLDRHGDAAVFPSDNGNKDVLLRYIISLRGSRTTLFHDDCVTPISEHIVSVSSDPLITSPTHGILTAVMDTNVAAVLENSIWPVEGEDPAVGNIGICVKVDLLLDGMSVNFRYDILWIRVDLHANFHAEGINLTGDTEPSHVLSKKPISDIFLAEQEAKAPSQSPTQLNAADSSLSSTITVPTLSPPEYHVAHGSFPPMIGVPVPPFIHPIADASRVLPSIYPTVQPSKERGHTNKPTPVSPNRGSSHPTAPFKFPSLLENSLDGGMAPDQMSSKGGMISKEPRAPRPAEGKGGSNLMEIMPMPSKASMLKVSNLYSSPPLAPARRKTNATKGKAVEKSSDGDPSAKSSKSKSGSKVMGNSNSMSPTGIMSGKAKPKKLRVAGMTSTKAELPDANMMRVMM